MCIERGWGQVKGWGQVTKTVVAIVFCPPPHPVRCTSLAAGSQGGAGSYGNTTKIQTEENDKLLSQFKMSGLSFSEL